MTTCQCTNEPVSCHPQEHRTVYQFPLLFQLITCISRNHITSTNMYGKAIKFAANRNIQRSTITRIYPSTSFFSSGPTHPHNQDSKFADDVRKSVSGLAPPSRTGADNHVNDSNFIKDVRRSTSGIAPSSSSSTNVDDRVNVVKTSTTPASSTTYDHIDNETDAGSYVAATAKQGVAKAMETGLNIGETAKQTLDNMWDATKDTTHKVKDAVTKNDKDKNDVPSTDQFVDDLRRRADGYDLRKD